MKVCTVKLLWEEGVWHTEVVDEDFCVTLESGSLDALIERVKIAIQEILEVDFKHTGDIQFNFQAERMDSVKSRAG